MGIWLSLPRAEKILDLNLTRGHCLKTMGKGRGLAGGILEDVQVCAAHDDVGNANMADIDGIDFDIINKDLVDCEDWLG